MIPRTPEDEKKEAFLLFEDGRYQESLDLCNRLLATVKEQSVEVLAATNLFYTGKTEDAEVFFRDLVQKMPESSYVHSYLAKVLERRGDEGAIAEYALAVRLDPTNQDALRSYADYLVLRKDYRAAVPVLRILVQLGKKPADVRHLARALIDAGEAQEALEVLDAGGAGHANREYVEALCATGRYAEAKEAAGKLCNDTRDPAMLRQYLGIVSRCDPARGLDAYEECPELPENCDILCDYVRLLAAEGMYARALERANELCSRSSRPEHRFLTCEILALQGNTGTTLEAFEQLIAAELRAKNDLVLLERIISSYRQAISSHLPKDEALARFQKTVSQDANVASLLETARLFFGFGDMIEARAWYYRAYRADYLNGGIFYAQYLAMQGEERECEKVMLYILSNVKKSADIGRVASVITDKNGTMFRMKRLMDQLIKKFVERLTTLSSGEMELLAGAYLIVARQALDAADCAGCKYACLCGLDVLPSRSRTCSPGDFLRILESCKELSIADRPVVLLAQANKRAAAARPAQPLADQMELSAQEQKIVEFLRSHRKATEMDLRKLLGTRRIAGTVNRLIKKASEQGIMLIDKKGVGEDGEIYEYSGT